MSSGDTNNSQSLPPLASFAQYQFDKDPRWENYLRGFECPSELTQQEFTYRIKRKFYDRFVSPPPPSPPPTTTTNTNATTSETTSTPSSSVPFNRTNTTAPPTATTPPPTSEVQGPANTLFDFSPARIPEKIWLFAGLSMMIHGLLCLIPFVFSSATNQTIFQRFLLSAIVNYTASLYQFHGAPQFNMQFLQRLMLDNNAQYLIVSILFLSNFPNPLFVFPVMTYTAFHVMNYLTPTLQQFQPNLATTFTNFQQQYSARVLLTCAYCEFFAIFLLVIQAFSGGSFLIIFGYWQFLMFRYLMSTYSRTAFSDIGERVDNVLLRPGVPTLIQGGYTKFRAFLSRFAQSRM